MSSLPLLSRGHSWRVWLAKQETLTPPGHLVSPLVCNQLMSTVVLYCWCHSDSASVLLYVTLYVKTTRRSGEVNKIYHDDYLKRPNWKDAINEEILGSLGDLEKQLVRRLV